MEGTLATCARHGQDRAGWRCTSCGSQLCPACTGQRRAGTTFLEVCALCGGMAVALKARRAELVPFLGTLPSALAWPAQHTGGIFACVACGLLVVVSRWLGTMASFIANGVILAYLFHVTRYTARGHDDFPGADDFRGYFEDVVAPMFRLTMATIWVWAPALALIATDNASPLAIVALCTLGVLLVPISLLASAVGTPVIHAANPLVLGAYAIRLGVDYFYLLIFCVVATSLAIGFTALADQVFLLQLFGSIILMIVPFAFFRALGLLLRARGDDLGYGAAEEYLVPVLGQRKPEAGIVEALPVPAQPAPAGPPQPLEIPAEARLVDAPMELVQKLRDGDVEGALAILEARPRDLPALTASAEAWFGLGRAGAERKLFKPALLALRRAIEVAPQGPLAPQAWLLAARLYDEGMQNRAESDRLLGELAKRFPQSPEGQFAAKRLGR